MLAKENLVEQTNRTLKAIELINLGAKPRFVSTETGININRTHKLFRDVTVIQRVKASHHFLPIVLSINLSSFF